MNFRNFHFYSGGAYLILVSIETYTRTNSGKSWKSKPAEIDRRIYNDEQYTNYISSIPFFNNFGSGAYCRGHYGYTPAGYLPIEVNTVSPYREIKKRARFEFIHKRELEAAAGYRELGVINHAKTWEFFDAYEKYRYITLQAGENTAVFDRITYKWVN